MRAGRPGIATLKGLGLGLAASLAAVLFVRADSAAAETCRPLPEARTIEANLNRFWGITAKLCQADDDIDETAAHPEERMVRANRRWLIAMGRRYGNWAVAGILAHEWGHMVQDRPPGTAAELQADCLAGAFMRAAGFSETDAFQFAELSFRNGDFEWRADGHGTGAQREKAVLTGYAGFVGQQGRRLDTLCPYRAH